MSIFQSLPDAWSVQHVFPAAPLSRHHERPTIQATIVDITCDSDGCIKTFAHPEDNLTNLPLHDNRASDERYYLGFFLVGAYQDSLANVHNLFGDCHEVVLRDPDEDILLARSDRIELGEVEAQLLAQDDVKEAVVIALNSPSGTQLVGYVSSRSPSLEAYSLRERLAQTLPDYMVPSTIMILDSLPLNANGKVDRKALPEPEWLSSNDYEAPQGEVEQALAEIWSDVLGVDKVGRHDSFFELGGNSLAVLKVNALLMQKSGYGIPIKTFFEARTVAALARSLPVESFASHGIDKQERLAAMDMMLQEFEV